VFISGVPADTARLVRTASADDKKIFFIFKVFNCLLAEMVLFNSSFCLTIQSYRVLHPGTSKFCSMDSLLD
jgi:hypothetical protein